MPDDKKLFSKAIDFMNSERLRLHAKPVSTSGNQAKEKDINKWL
jgi:hypothetical protein